MRASLVFLLLVAVTVFATTETLPFGSPERGAAFEEYIALCSPARDATTFNRSAELRELLWGAKSGFVDYATRYQLGSSSNSRAARPDYRFRFVFRDNAPRYPMRAYDRNHRWFPRRYTCALGMELRLLSNGTHVCEITPRSATEKWWASLHDTAPRYPLRAYDIHKSMRTRRDGCGFLEDLRLQPNGTYSCTLGVRYREWDSVEEYLPLPEQVEFPYVRSYHNATILVDHVHTEPTPPMTVRVGHGNYTLMFEQALRSLNLFYSY